ncbi:hypothetical protein ATANTOWER_028191 [Ataeniobius toweri]|uniref:Secreted protein n=1 Tax=Ataeniobius toweri TaxID=208326 RepID=A0ABU7CIS6_9TELE|nr:hypothetical protein [Ataeniobius toweri]
MAACWPSGCALQSLTCLIASSTTARELYRSSEVLSCSTITTPQSRQAPSKEKDRTAGHTGTSCFDFMSFIYSVLLFNFSQVIRNHGKSWQVISSGLTVHVLNDTIVLKIWYYNEIIFFANT